MHKKVYNILTHLPSLPSSTGTTSDSLSLAKWSTRAASQAMHSRRMRSICFSCPLVRSNGARTPPPWLPSPPPRLSPYNRWAGPEGWERPALLRAMYLIQTEHEGRETTTVRIYHSCYMYM
jgi:hypothetical protein